MCLEYNKESIKISTLIGISILFENDLYELACFLVKMHRTQDEMANRKSITTRQSSSSTLLGLAHNYAHLTNMPSDRVKKAMKQAGLSLGATIMDHGGDIRVESEPGRGAEFTVVLPLRQ